MYKSEKSNNKEHSLVSIIIYASSKKAYLKNIREFTGQTYDNVEIIIVANESFENSKSGKNSKKLLSKFLQNYSKKDRIKIVKFERNFDSNAEPVSKNEAFLFGARHANGDYFLFADENTFWNNTFVENAVTMLEDNDADLATSDCAILWKNGDCYLHSLKLDVSKYITPFNQFMLSSGMLYGLSSMSNKFIRRDLWKKSTEVIEKTYNESVNLSFFCGDLIFSAIIVSNASKIVHNQDNYFVNIWKDEDDVISEYAGSKSIDKIVKELEIAFKLLKRLCANIIDEKMFALIQNNLLSVFIWRINWAVPDIDKLEETFGEIGAEYNLGEAFKGRISSIDAESLFTETNDSSFFKFKIQNLLFPRNNIEWEMINRDMFCRGQPLIYNAIDETWTLEHGVCECFTYFNSLSVEKWNMFTNATAYNLHLLVKGKLHIRIFGHWLKSEDQSASFNESLNEIRNLDISDIKKRDFIHETIRKAKADKETMVSLLIDNTVAREIIIPIEYEKSTVIGFTINAITPVTIYDGYYTAEIPEEQLNTVDIAICTTTFKKEEYIKSNIKLLKEEIFEGNGSNGCDKLKNHLYMLVVDNGRTLKESEINSDRIKLFANPNTGGAGGFSRGMLETMNLAKNGDFNATHVLFMDDDIEILPESLKRTYSLLALVKDEYKDYFISGAMLNIEDRKQQFENLGFISESSNCYLPVKPCFDLQSWNHILLNEIEYPLNNMYAAWWYCVAPIKFINEKELSLPIFYRTDDIEFSLRNSAKFITLNGIGVWHLPFNKKENEALEYYLVIRNSMIMQAISNVALKANFIERINRVFKEEIRKFNYTACEHLLDALDDYMKGPEFIQKLNGEEKIKSQSKKNLKLVPSTVFGITDSQLGSVYDYVPLRTDDMSIFESTDNGHTLPDYLLVDDTYAPVIAQMFFESPGKQFKKKHIMLVSAANKKAALLTMDKEKYTTIKRRYDELMAKYEKEKEKIAAEYRGQSAKLHSADFWREYLGIDGS